MLHQCVPAGAVSVIVIAAVWLLIMVIVTYQEKLAKQRWKIDAAKLEADHQKSRADRFELRVDELKAESLKRLDDVHEARRDRDRARQQLDTLRAKLRAL